MTPAADNLTAGCGPIVAVFALLGAAVLIIEVVKAHVRTRQASFEKTAHALRGRYQPAGFGTYDRIEFPLDGTLATVEFISGREEDVGGTRITVPLPNPSPGTLHILPDGFGQAFLKMFGSQDLIVGEPDFDRKYVVKATPESFVGRFFSPDRRSRLILAVRQLEDLSHPTLEVTRNYLRVQVREVVRSVGRLHGLISAAREFLEVLRVDSGIELGELATRTGSTCPVCGMGLGVSAVRCERCKTPHHLECWRYVGQCSTYACTGKRFVA
jgi:hypothetical protein